MRWLILLTLLSFVVGCGPTAKKPTAKKNDKKTPAPAKETPKPPEAKQSDFPDFDTAMAAVVTGTQENKTWDIRKAEAWMGLQGESLAPKLIEKVKNPSTNLIERISAIRVYGRMGNVATPLMLEYSKPGTEPEQLRINAVQCLGMPEHPDKEALIRLCDLVSDSNPKIRLAALRALGAVGADAKKQRPEIVKQLQDLLNSPTDSDDIRFAAKAALKKIEPRIGFSGMGKADK